jgi:RNA polymerase sigma-70 factor (ECF subfamily)
MSDGTDECAELLERAGAGDAQALGDLFARHQERLRRMVQVRMDPRLQSRLDPADVLQETYLEVSRCLDDYLRNPILPFFLWLRLLTSRKLLALHRHHLGTHQRAAGREIALGTDRHPEADSENLAIQLLARLTSPSKAAMRAELQSRVQAALEQMEPLDREVLALRHFEQLSNMETAQVLGLSEAAASKRYLRAVKRLREILEDVPGFLDTGRQPSKADQQDTPRPGQGS